MWPQKSVKMFSNVKKHKLYYKQYCKILSKVIKEAKRFYYKEIITKSNNKIKTMWNIINKEIGNSTNENSIKSLRINNHTVYIQASIPNEFNNYFSNIVDGSGIKEINENAEDACLLQYLFKYFKQPFKVLNWSY